MEHHDAKKIHSTGQTWQIEWHPSNKQLLRNFPSEDHLLSFGSKKLLHLPDYFLGSLSRHMCTI
jgi:hypothetical protein